MSNQETGANRPTWADRLARASLLSRRGVECVMCAGTGRWPGLASHNSFFVKFAPEQASQQIHPLDRLHKKPASDQIPTPTCCSYIIILSRPPELPHRAGSPEADTST